ncbi:prolactin-inducible protein homolog [Mastomys coucha]|uniref:prolactin-inducible protein homolog n=1 Tax=Mastomys coucha TaxID=35658 RepID=UPI0012629C39|nr:prolactin-inducible protein homolog [Mastomys coucha]
MPGLSFMFSAATLILVLCLQLGIIEGQDTENTRKALTFNLSVPSRAQRNEEISLALELGTQYKECMVIKTYLVSSVPIEGGFNYVQTRCLCPDYPTTIYWDFIVTETATIAIVVDIVKERNICPNDVAVVPITGDRYHTIHTIYVN